MRLVMEILLQRSCCQIEKITFPFYENKVTQVNYILNITSVELWV